MTSPDTSVLDGTVDQVNDYLAEHPDEREALLAAEADGQNRKGIMEGPHAEAPPADPGPVDASDGTATDTATGTAGTTFAEASEASTASLDAEDGLLGVSPERDRTGMPDKGLSQRNPAVMNQGGMVPDARPGVDDSAALKA